MSLKIVLLKKMIEFVSIDHSRTGVGNFFRPKKINTEITENWIFYVKNN